MLMTIQQESKKGYFDSKTVTVPTVKKGLDNVIKVLESMPERIDGVPQYDWSRITITFEN